LEEAIGKLKQVVEDLQTEAQRAGDRFDQAPSGPVMAPSSIAKEDPLQQMASFLTGPKRGGGGGGRGDEIEETQELPGAPRFKIPRKLPTFGSGAC
jgi:hypothetical protein